MMSDFVTLDPKSVSQGQFHALMLGCIAPRPIAFVSTVDSDGVVNLAPFSFFNAFGSNPPILVFSPARRGRDNTTKHTLENVLVTKECVVNVVNYAMVEQISLASTEYAAGVNEFHKSGLTMIPSHTVKPYRVKEAPVQFECRGLRGESEKRPRLRWRSVQYPTERMRGQFLIQNGCGILRHAVGIVRENPRHSVVLHNFVRFLQILRKKKSGAIGDAV